MPLPLPRPLIAAVPLLVILTMMDAARGHGDFVGQAPDCAPTAARVEGVRRTTNGPVRGIRSGETEAYLGIPYAAAPVGDLRLRPPAPLACSPEVRETVAFGEVCPQLSAGRVVGDEDCLTLNVWMPVGDAGDGRPVLFFLHGGGNVQGSTAQQLPDGTRIYDGARLAASTGTVVVTANYRLGPLGFLAHPALSAESEHAASGNYGILDQVAALQWLQHNIAGFGGDPARVLLFGESAGAVDACVLIASPLARGLFASALMESGSCVQPGLAARQRSGETLSARVGCDGRPDVTSCLRSRSVTELLTAVPIRDNPVLEGAPDYGPAVDGWVLTGSPLDVIRAGQHNRVPLAVGTNADETGQAVPLIRSEEEYRAAVMRAVPSGGVRILEQYPASGFATPRQAYVAWTSDARFTCPARMVARAAASGQSEPVYRYFFTHALDAGPGRLFGAFHGLEVLFLFQQLRVAGYVPSEAERALSVAIGGYWSRLAATGDPNGVGAVAWPRYDPSSDPYLRLDSEIAADFGVRSDRCDWWDQLLGPIAAGP